MWERRAYSDRVIWSLASSLPTFQMHARPACCSCASNAPCDRQYGTMSDSPAIPGSPVVEEEAASASASASAAQQPVDAAEAARLKREARKARILSKGSDRLARITNTGRGEGASAYLDSQTPLGGGVGTESPSLSTPTSAVGAAGNMTSSTSTSTSTSSASASVAKPSTTVSAEDDDPLEVDISTLPQRRRDMSSMTSSYDSDMMASNPFLGQGAPGGEGPGMPQNPMEALMAMMQGGGAGGMGGMGGMGTGPDGQPDMSGLPPQLAAMMQQFGAGAGGAGGPGGASIAPTATRTKSAFERIFDLLQAALVVLLAVVAAKSSLFNDDHSSLAPVSISVDSAAVSGKLSTMQRWARLGYQKPSPEEWALSPSMASSRAFATLPGLSFASALPMFWLFLGLEVSLQAIRIVIFSKKTPAPPSLLATLASALPIPHINLAIRLAGKYLALVNAFVNDFAILVFVFGASVIWSTYSLGGPAHLESTPIARPFKDEL
ncbi:hypothetical protein BCV70DRAFT_212115 [Testicularia cyperi]|uniref:Golgi to ER traffic protein 2 n=1 Tax=Testicularia cyperi TaxID=1882483 RepID=A0A317XPG1_9BASI|nr:hypothetical protein BCV70DRAFT_212115 [Testicularia cyperi]